MSDLVTYAVAIYLGFALAGFFHSITHDLVTPLIAGVFPNTEKSLDKIVINVGSIKLNVGEVISNTFDLLIAFFVVSFTLPYIRAYAPVGGRK